MTIAITEVEGQFLAGEDEAATFVHRFSNDQMNWQPRHGKAWSIAQCLDHLARTNEEYTAAMLRPIESAPQTGKSVKTCQPSLFGGYFIRALEPPAKFRVPAPPKLQPPSTLDKNEVLDRFHQSHRDLREIIRAMQGRDPNSIRFRNPIAPLLTVRVGTALLIIAAHERRHIWQANNVAAAISAATR